MSGNEEHVPDRKHFRDDYHHNLFGCSGEVRDPRRIVQFLYLLLRDRCPTSVVAEALMRTLAPKEGETSDWAVALRQAHPELYPDPLRLVRTPTGRHELFLVQLCQQFQKEDGQGVCPPLAISATFDLLPAGDDVQTFYSNGWLAQYCQYVVDKLADPTS